MAWLLVIAILVVVAAAFSIHGTIDDCNELATEHPTFSTLVSYTGIGKREFFNKLLGTPDAQDCYYLPTYKLQHLPRRKFHEFIESPYLDMSRMLASMLSLLIWRSNPPLASVVMGIAAAPQLVGYVLAFVGLYQSDLWQELFDDTSNTGSG